MAHQHDDGGIAHPEVLTLHWEGPSPVEDPPEYVFPGSPEEARAVRARERASELQEIRRCREARELWAQIASEAVQRGDPKTWGRKLHAFWWVKMRARGTARDYAGRFDLNHATVRSWIADVAKLAYQVGYRLHEDKLLLVGEAPEGLARLRALVNADAASEDAAKALREAEVEFRGRDPYFHLNEGHVLRARGDLRGSDETLKEGLAIAEAPRVRSLLWNARGQTLWDCTPGSSYPLADALVQAEMCFRRAALLDRSTWFPFVNLAQLAVDAGDAKRAEYWIGELAVARKGMDDEMKTGLAEYLAQAEWTTPVEQRRFWRKGPMKWIVEAFGKAALAVAVVALVIGLAGGPARALADADAPPGAPVENGGGRDGGSGSNSGAGGN